MKTVTKTYDVYTFEELSQEAKDKAREKWITNNDYPFLSDYLNERLHELLEENKIKDTNDTSKPNTKPTPVLYSLSHCQGDGAMFEGTFEWQHLKKTYTAVIKQSGYYYHYNSKTIELTYEDKDGNEHEADEKTYTHFNDIYVTICQLLAQDGYNYIDYENSEECFRETCEANEYNFLADGTMVNY